VRPLFVLTVVAVAVAAAVWPYAGVLDQLPWGADASRWVSDGSLDNPHWWSWATDRKHFVGYRPVTALSFVLDHALFGYSALGYRVTDLVLHAASGLLVAALWVALTGDRGPAVLVPVLVLLGHPATEEVVPYVPRRSYLLATDFGVLALLAAWRAMRSERAATGWSVAAAVSFGIAVLANETAYVVLPLAVLLAWWGVPRTDRRKALRRLLPLAVVCVAAIARRYEVLGTWSGGYEKRYFAFVHDGIPVWTEMTRWEPRRIAEAAWQYLLAPHGVSGASPLVPASFEPTAILIFATVLVWTGVVEPLRRWRTDPSAWFPIWCTLWLAGATAIVVLSQTWFWRQDYSLLVPLGFLCALAIDRAARALAAGRITGLVIGAPTAVLFASLLYTGPLVHRMDEVVLERQLAGNLQAHRLREAIAPLEGPATVWLVAPSATTVAHLVRLWGDRFGASRRISFRLLGSLSPGALPSQAKVSIGEQDGRPELRLDRGLLLTTALGGVPRQGPLPLDRLYRAGRGDWLLALDADDEVLVQIPPPPPAPFVGPPLPAALQEVTEGSPSPSSTGEVPPP